MVVLSLQALALARLDTKQLRHVRAIYPLSLPFMPFQCKFHRHCTANTHTATVVLDGRADGPDVPDPHKVYMQSIQIALPMSRVFTFFKQGQHQDFQVRRYELPPANVPYGMLVGDDEAYWDHLYNYHHLAPDDARGHNWFRFNVVQGFRIAIV
jgi:hypothetical protein